MSRTETLELSATPHGEECAQVGELGYSEKARQECRAYINQLLRVAAAAGIIVPETVRLIVKGNAHDFGQYYEVVVRFPEEEEAAADVAYWFEQHQPDEWDEAALVELGRVEGAT